MTIRKVLPATLALGLLIVGSADADSPGRVSEPNALAGVCEPAPGSLVSSFESRDSGIAPSVAVDPADPRRIAVAYLQDFPQAIVVASSGDGGGTWSRTIVPGLSRCTGGDEEGVQDPAVTFDAQGAILLAAVVGHENTVPFPLVSTGLAVVRSEDHGATWSAPVLVQPVDGWHAALPAWAVSRSVPGLVHLSWFARTGPGGASGELRHARSEDGGLTWSAPRVVHSPDRQGIVPSANTLQWLEVEP